MLLAYGTLLPQTNITHLSNYKMYHPEAPLSGDDNESPVEHSYDLFFL